VKELNRDLYQECNEDLMSNFDHQIEPNAEELLKSSKIYGGYPGWNFHGDVWFEDNKFYCEIWQWGNHVNTLEAESLREIMDEASEYYGSN